MSDIKKLPDWIDPSRLAQTHAQLEGYLSMRAMDVLKQHTEGDLSALNVFCRLNFSVQSKRIICEGQLQADLPLLCQRCLEVMTFRVEKPLSYCFLEPGESDEQIDAAYEALWLEEVPLKLAELLEEELVLSLPFIAKHEQCPSLSDEIAEILIESEDIPAPEPEMDEAPKPNPFAALDQLK